MGVSHLRRVASHTANAVQAQRVPFKSVEDALESSLGHDPELSILGDICRYISM